MFPPIGPTSAAEKFSKIKPCDAAQTGRLCAEQGAEIGEFLSRPKGVYQIIRLPAALARSGTQSAHRQISAHSDDLDAN